MLIIRKRVITISAQFLKFRLPANKRINSDRKKLRAASLFVSGYASR
jgi:hypothetical protein